MGLLAGKTLATAVAPGDTSLRITPPLALGDNPAGQPIQIGTELMMVTGGKRGLVGLARAADSAHTQGSAITELNPFVATAPQEGGAALTVDNGTDPPAPIATIDAPGAVIDGDVATFPSRFYAQTTDPGAVGAGAVWKDTTLSGSSTKWWERNAANDGWDAFAVRRTVSTGDDPSDASTYAATTGSGTAAAILRADAGGDGGANASATAATSGGGEADASSNAIAAAGGDAYASSYAETVDGAADASLTAESSGEGDANVEATATATTGEATAGSSAVRGAVTAGMACVVDATSGRMAFNGETPIAKPTGVAVTAEAIHAALVSLGLIEA